MDKNIVINHDHMIKQLSNLSAEEFLNLGSDGLSYIKIVKGNEGEALYALHSASGSHIATGQDINYLKAIAVQNELAPMTIQ